MRSALSQFSRLNNPPKEFVVTKEPVPNNSSVTHVVQTVHCPTCGSLAERRLLNSCQASIGVDGDRC